MLHGVGLELNLRITSLDLAVVGLDTSVTILMTHIHNTSKRQCHIFEELHTLTARRLATRRSIVVAAVAVVTSDLFDVCS